MDAGLSVGGMVDGIESDVRPKEAVCADGHSGAVENDAAEVDVDVVLNCDVFAELTAEIRLDPDILAHGAKQLIHQRAAFRLLIVIRPVVCAEQALGRDAALEQAAVEIVVELPGLQLFPLGHTYSFALIPSRRNRFHRA